MLAKVLIWAVLIWIGIWAVYHPADVHQIMVNIGRFYAMAKR